MNDKPKEYRANFGRAELEANWVTFEPTDKRIGPINLLLRPLTGGQRTSFGAALSDRDREKQVEVLTEIIVDWNLENDDGKIPVDPSNLETWGDRLAHLRVELHPDIFTDDEIEDSNSKGENSAFLGTLAIIYAGRPGNFLKN